MPTYSIIFMSNLQLFSTVRIVVSTINSDHKAVVAYQEGNLCAPPKSTFQRTFRSKTPAQHALFLQHVANMNFDNPHPSASSDPSINTQSEFNHFYSTSIALLNQFYPEQTITLTTRDPDYITPEIKAKLRRKNRLMRAGRVEEAGALAERIRKDMSRHSRTRLSKIDGRTDAKDM